MRNKGVYIITSDTAPQPVVIIIVYAHNIIARTATK